jgi:ribosomal protein L37E
VGEDEAGWQAPILSRAGSLRGWHWEQSQCGPCGLSDTARVRASESGARQASLAPPRIAYERAGK